VRLSAKILLGLTILCGGCSPQNDKIVKAWSDAEWGSFFPTDPICANDKSSGGKRLNRAYSELDRLNTIAQKYYPDSEPVLQSPDAMGCPDLSPEAGTPLYVATSRKAEARAAHIERLNVRLAAALREVDWWPNSWINGSHIQSSPPPVVATVS
jgi:hypothetical protein